MTIITRRFGGWNRALEKAGLPLNKKNKLKYTDEELLQLLKDKAQELGRSPYRRELIEGATIDTRFGSWNKALEKAGLEANKEKSSDEELLQAIRDKAEILGRIPRQVDVEISMSICQQPPLGS